VAFLVSLPPGGSVLAARDRAPAAEPAPPVVASLAVTGPRDCASRADVLALVARRSTRIRFVEGAPAGGGPALRVTLDATPAGAVAGALTVVWPDGTRADRRLTAPTCAETADAVALVIVLALDPAAAMREPAPSPPPARPSAQRPRAAPGPTPAPAPPSPSQPSPGETPASEPSPPERERVPVPPPAPDETTSRPPPAPPASPPPPVPTPDVAVDVAAAAPPVPSVFRFAVGGAARVIQGPTPSLLPGVALVAHWERDAASVLSWKIQVAAAHHQRAGWTTKDGTADFSLDVMTLDLCPLRLGRHAVAAHLCAGAALGRLTVTGTDTFSPRTQSRPFVSAGGAILLTVAPHPRVELTASVAPQVALIRDHFRFNPNVFYDVPALALSFGLGAALTFP